MTRFRFRAWHPAGKIMSFGGVFFNNSTGELEHDPTCVLMQSTDYGDVDGEEMFESDIVELRGCRAVIRWGDGGFYFDPITDEWIDDWNIADDASRFRIIGNEHEDPDLLPKAA